MQTRNALGTKIIDAAMIQAENSLLNGADLFSEILGSRQDSEALRNDLARLKGPGLRFLELCYRSEDPQVWAQFVTREQNKGSSPWKSCALKQFGERLGVWWSDQDTPSPINQELALAFHDLGQYNPILGDGDPTSAEYQRWRLFLLRRVLRRLLRGEET